MLDFVHIGVFQVPGSTFPLEGKMRFWLRVGGVAVMTLLVSVSLSAQWARHPQAGAPRTADGRVRLDAPTPRTPDG